VRGERERGRREHVAPGGKSRATLRRGHGADGWSLAAELKFVNYSHSWDPAPKLGS